MKPEDQVKLVEFAKAEGEELLAEMNGLLVKYSAVTMGVPFIQPNGTIGATVQLFKKISAIETGIPSPKEFQSDATGETTTESAKKAD